MGKNFSLTKFLKGGDIGEEVLVSLGS